MSGQLLNPPAPPEQRKTVFDPRTIMLGLTGYAIQVANTTPDSSDSTRTGRPSSRKWTPKPQKHSPTTFMTR